ncbi:MAG: ABC transporter permease [Acidobacteria bacterium]|nr:ABC transporter permease [Acidobacteriota bacterium]
MENLKQDILYAVRTVLKQPAFAVVAILTIALGIGANTAIFSLVNAALIRPLPVESPEELMFVYHGTRETPYLTASYPDYVDLRNQNTVFSDLIAYAQSQVSFTSGEGTEIISAVVVTGNYFDMLGVRPILGRDFASEEDQVPNTHAVTVLNYAFWQGRFSGDPNIVGRSLMINGRNFTVIGVAPPGFTAPDLLSDFSIYVPMMMQELVRPPSAGGGGNPRMLDQRGRRWITMMGRLKPGISREEAQGNITAINEQIQQLHAATNREIVATLHPATEGRPGVRQRLIPVAWLLMTVAGIVLLIACANVANLLLVHNTSRRREIAIRLSLGASRARLISQLLMESAIISIAGAAIGLLIGSWSLSLLFRATAIQTIIPIRIDLGLDPRVLTFTLLLSFLTGVVFGLAPAVRSARTDVVPELKNDVSGADGGRLFGLRNTLVIAQMAMSLVLLAAAGLFLRSLWASQSTALGMDLERVALMQLNLNLAGYDRPRSTEFYRRVVERVEAIPGVEAAGLSRVLPLSGATRLTFLFLEGRDYPDNRADQFPANTVSSNFFASLGIPLIRGRNFNDQDGPQSQRVAIVSKTLADRAWPGQDPIGKVVRTAAGAPPIQIVGVVADSKYGSTREENQPVVYYPLSQNLETYMFLTVRTPSDPARLLAVLRSQVQAMDPRLPLSNVRTMLEHVRIALLPDRLAVLLLGVFAGLAVLLAAVGTYGIVSYSVSQRTREIGIRMAVGAQNIHVLKLIVGKAMMLAVIGILIGLAAAFGVTRFARAFLFGVTPTDPLTFAAVAAILAVVALVSSYIPARRAAKMDPLAALRIE